MRFEKLENKSLLWRNTENLTICLFVLSSGYEKETKTKKIIQKGSHLPVLDLLMKGLIGADRGAEFII